MNKIALVFLALLLSTSSLAGVDNSLKTMLSTAATRSGATLTFTSPATLTKDKIAGFGRVAVDLGGLRLRTPVESYNLMSFSKPNLSAGCSGIDLVLGSFSFLSKDELIAMFRSIASNALTYGFGIAIKGMCESCWTMMNSLQEKMQELNQMFSNTCNVAKCLVDENGTGCKENALSDMGCMFTAGWTEDSDYSACKDEGRETNAKALQSTRIAANAAADESEGFLMGNQTYEMINTTIASDFEAKFAGFKSIFNLDVSAMEFIISLIGTTLIDTNGNATHKDAILSLKDFFDPSNADIAVGSIGTMTLRCVAGSEYTANNITYKCMEMKPKYIALNLINLDTFIQEKFDNIIAVLNSTTLTAAQINGLSDLEAYLLNYIDQHLLDAMIVGTDNDGKQAATLLKDYAPIIANKIRNDVSDTIINLTKKIVSDSTDSQETRGYESYYKERLLFLSKQKSEFNEKFQEVKDGISKETSWLELKRIYGKSVYKQLAEISGR